MSTAAPMSPGPSGPGASFARPRPGSFQPIQVGSSAGLLLVAVAVLGSAAAHVVFASILAFISVGNFVQPRTQYVDLDVIQPPPPPPEPETPPPPEPDPPPEPETPVPPPPEPERERRRDREPQPVGVPDPPPDTPPNPDPAPLREEPVDFGGVTLTNDEGAWATQTGSGAAMTGPITTARHVGPRSVRGRDDGMRGGTGTGAAGAGRPPPDLTRRARCTGPPAGSDYPVAAREAGVEGVVELRASLDANGRVISTTLRGSDPGWGMRQRCESSVRSRWRCDPALDATGRSVPTTVTLRCRYELND